MFGMLKPMALSMPMLHSKILTSFFTQVAGTSGRTLRKLPLISLSEHFRTVPVSLDRFLMALAMSIRQLARHQR